jgi:hypothetical protein
MGTVGDWLLAAGLSGGLAQARPRLVSQFVAELLLTHFVVLSAHDGDTDAIASFAENGAYTHPALPGPLVGDQAVAECTQIRGVSRND